jgi:septum formation protein
VDEIAEGDPVEVARENARLKAEAIASRRGPQDGRPILATDTIVRLGETIYGKPRDERHAAEILAALSGQTHEVVSGLALHRDGATETLHATTRVQFRDLQPLLQWYLRTGEWAERAGAYAIQGQGAAFVTAIEGDYLNVVGLPVAALLDLWPEVLDLRQ